MSSSPESPKDCLGQPLPEPRGSATTDVREAHRRPAEENQSNRLAFRCDDASGFELLILRSDVDRDFYVGLRPKLKDYREEYGLEPAPVLFQPWVRIRMPMLGGGGHPELYEALVSLWRAKGFLEDAPPVLADMDDGSSVLLDSYAGGAHPAGTWSRLRLRFRAADGTETVREYVSTHPADLKQTGTIPFERP
jgi:hypothetical protein